MDALEFLKECKRMCNCYDECYDCPLKNTVCTGIGTVLDEDFKRAIDTVEQWSKEHPRKTRQSVFLEQWPNVITNNGVIDILPCNIDQSLVKCTSTDCSKCKCEFWLKEIDE